MANSLLALLRFCVMGVYLFAVEFIDGLKKHTPYSSGSVTSNRGKTAIVTGGNGGIGLSTAKAFVQDGVSVLIAARSKKTAEEAVEQLQGHCRHGATVSWAPCDVSSLKSVKEFCETYVRKHDALDILVCNAGIMACPFALSEDGFESQFATNHLGHFLMIQLLLPLLLKAKKDTGRIVILTSCTHAQVSALDLEQWNSNKDYDPGHAYESSKLINVLTTYELHRRLQETVRVYAVHPGVVATGIARGLPKLFAMLYVPIAKVLLKTPDQGAETSVWCALSAEAATLSGKYFANCSARSSSKLSYDESLAKDVYERSMDLVKPFMSSVKATGEQPLSETSGVTTRRKARRIE